MNGELAADCVEAHAWLLLVKALEQIFAHEVSSTPFVSTAVSGGYRHEHYKHVFATATIKGRGAMSLV